MEVWSLPQNTVILTRTDQLFACHFDSHMAVATISGRFVFVYTITLGCRLYFHLIIIKTSINMPLITN